MLVVSASPAHREGWTAPARGCPVQPMRDPGIRRPPGAERALSMRRVQALYPANHEVFSTSGAPDEGALCGERLSVASAPGSRPTSAHAIDNPVSRYTLVYTYNGHIQTNLIGLSPKGSTLR